MTRREEAPQTLSALGRLTAPASSDTLRTDEKRDRVLKAAIGEFQTARRHDAAKSWRDVIRRCLERVPERGQDILRARYADELSFQQIAERLGMNIEAVRKALFRLRKQVRSCVENSLRAVE